MKKILFTFMFIGLFQGLSMGQEGQMVANFSFDDEVYLLSDQSDLHQTAKAIGSVAFSAGELIGRGSVKFDNNPNSTPQSRVIVYDHSSLDLNDSFTLEVWFKLATISENWEAYNGSPRILCKTGSRSPNLSNYAVGLERKDGRTMLLCGFYNGREWNEVKMGDAPAEPTIQAGNWYGLVCHYNAVESSLTLFVFDATSAGHGFSPAWDSAGLIFWEKAPVLGRPLISEKPLVIGHSGGEEPNGWFDGCIDQLVIYKGIRLYDFMKKIDITMAPIQDPNLRAYQIDKHSVRLTWRQNSPRDTYRIYRSENANFTSGQSVYLDKSLQADYVDVSANARNIYYYRVGLVDPLKKEYHVTNQAVGLLLPSIESLHVIPRRSSLELSWDLPGAAYELNPIVGYNVYRRTANDPEIDLLQTPPIATLPNITRFSDGGLTPGQTYYYRVAARSREGSLGQLSQEIGAVTDTKSTYTSFANVSMLVIVYTSTAGGRISTIDIDRLKKGFELGREFIWRHTGAQLNIDISYLVVDDFKDDNFFPHDGNLWAEFVEHDFRSYGVLPQQYGLIMCVYTPPTEEGGNYGAMKIMGETGYAFLRFPFQEPNLYPARSGGVNYAATWLFIRQVQHTLNAIPYNGQLWRADRMYDNIGLEGEAYDYLAGSFRNFKDYLSLKSFWGRILESEDNDRDGLPDNDPRLPLDERRFDSDATLPDSDGDELTDLAEYMNGLFEGTDPQKVDTDGDSRPDNSDLYPLQTVNGAMPQKDISIDGQWEKGWQLLLDDVYFAQDDRFKADVYGAWTDDGISLAVIMNRPAPVRVDLDCAGDGWFHGQDNLQFRFDPETEMWLAHVLDATPEARRFNRSQTGKDEPIWDDDLHYVAWRPRLVDQTKFSVRSQPNSDNYLLEFRLPKNQTIGLVPEAGQRIHFRLFFEGVNATAFEPYRFVTVNLY